MTSPKTVNFRQVVLVSTQITANGFIGQTLSIKATYRFIGVHQGGATFASAWFTLPTPSISRPNRRIVYTMRFPQCPPRPFKYIQMRATASVEVALRRGFGFGSMTPSWNDAAKVCRPQGRPRVS